MRLSDLLGCTAVTEDGWRVGHVFEVRAERRDGRPVVVSVLAGPAALRERVLGGRAEDGARRAAAGAEIAWEAVVAIEGRRLRVREDERHRVGKGA